MSLFHCRFVGHITSVNRWTNTKCACVNYRYIPQVYETAEYKTFKNYLITRIGGIIQLDPKKYYDMRIRVSLRKGRDSSNPLKPTEDAIQKAGVIKNDSHIRNIMIVRAYHAKGAPDVMEIDLYNITPQDDSWAQIQQGELIF